MISPFRQTVASIPRYVRTISVGGSAHDAETVSQAFGAMGSNVPASSAQPPAVTSQQQSRASSMMDIPPSEDPLLHYLTSSLLTHGHRAKASRITSQTLLHIHAFTRAAPLPILRHAILSASPAVRTLMHRKGGKTVPKPVALGEKQRTRYAVQWILKASESKPGRTVSERLARELIAVVEGTSSVLKDQKEKVHQFAMVNRGNAPRA